MTRVNAGHPYTFLDSHKKVRCPDCGDKVARGSLEGHKEICRATHDEGGSG